jgi:hypothetical protein
VIYLLILGLSSGSFALGAWAGIRHARRSRPPCDHCKRFHGAARCRCGRAVTPIEIRR